MNIKTMPIWIIYLFTASFLGGCGSSLKEKSQEQTFKASLYRVQPQDLPLYTTAMANIESYQKAQLSTRIMGQVKAVLINEGDRVRAGQILVQLDKEDITSRVEQSKAMLDGAKSQLENARAYFQRIERLYAEQSATRQALDNARAQFEGAESQVKAAESMIQAARSNLNYADITAPFAGLVASKTVQKGDLASPGMRLVTVEVQDSMKIVTTVSEQEVGLISTGDKVWVETDVPGLGRREGVIEVVVPAGDPRTRRFTVKIVVPNPEGKLKSGMFARVLFQTGIIQTLSVPDSAVVRRGQLTGLFVLDENNRSRLLWIRLGRKSDHMVEVLTGLNPGDRVVVSGQGIMREGQKVEEVSL